MRSHHRLLIAAAVVTLAACSSSRPQDALVPLAGAPEPAPAPSPSGAAPRRDDPDPGWPRAVVDAQGWRVTAWQPQLERWTGNGVTARVATTAIGPRAPAHWAAVVVHARAEVDKVPRVVTLHDVTVERVRVADPVAPSDEAQAALARDLPLLLGSVALDRLTVDLGSQPPAAGERAVAVRNDPPRILVVTRLTVLLPIDGAPVWRRASERFDRILNTRALVLFDRTRRWLYAWVGDTWYRTRDLGGDWRTATLVPPGLDALRAQLSGRGEVDLVDEPGSPLARALSVGRVPQLVVSTEPAELVSIEGAPAMTPIEGTQLSSVENSDHDLFADAGGRMYLVLSGRWYRAQSLDGPWQWVAAAALPRDFAAIPPDHPRARVLAAVPGTAEAAAARVADEIPETATVRIAGTALRVDYDGAPRFARLEGTLFDWAVNSATPVLQLSAPVRGEGLYYALADGLWFTGPTAEGPWRVATSVPAAIYDIPARAPLHFVTYARVYGHTDDAVHVGYTPGYVGSCLGDDGVVVFGTGYAYAPWAGHRFIGRPATFGFAARWEPGLGWTLGGDAGAARATYRPWWRPTYDAVSALDAETFADERVDLYARWSDAVVRRPGGARGEVVAGADDVYAGSDGHLYRARGDAWERRVAGGWQPARSLQASAAPRVSRDQLRLLDGVRRARGEGQARWELFRETATPLP